MYKIDSYGSVSGQWTNGNPATLTPATVMDATWFNALQAEIVNVILASGQTLDKFNSSQLLTALNAMLSAVPSSNRNLIINGDFRIAQRRKTATLSVAGGELAGFVCDRWRAAADVGAGVGVATVSRQAFAVGQTAVPGDPRYFLQHVQSTAASAGAPTVSQKIESVRGQAGEQRAISFWAQGLTAYNATARVLQNFGTGGSPSSPVVCGTQVCAITTTWTRFTMVVTLPAITGNTLGTDDNDHLLLELQLPTGTTYTFRLAEVQLEPGSVVNAFARRLLTTELSLCQRYYEKSYEAEVDPGTVTLLGARSFYEDTNQSNQGNIVGAHERFASEKRAAPAIAWYCVGASSNNVVGRVNRNQSSTVVGGTNNIGKRSTGTPTGAFTAGVGVGFCHWTADAEL